MRLTIDLIQDEADQGVDPDKHRSLVLRGHKIAVIENLGVTRDMYGSLDLSDNEIVKIPALPKLVRLKTLLLANNAISRVAPDAFDSVPELISLVLTNNRISRLAALLPLAALTKLERISLVHNSVTNEVHYRAFLIHLQGYSHTFRYIDFQRITDAERTAAKLFFASPEGVALLKTIAPEPITAEETEAPKPERRLGLSQDILDKIQAAIIEATDMSVVDKLERTLKTGEISDDVAGMLGLQ